MTIVAITLAAALVAATITFAGLLRAQQRQHARERDLLINQLLHLTGRTWTPPPAEQETPAEPIRLLRNVDQLAPEDRV